MLRLFLLPLLLIALVCSSFYPIGRTRVPQNVQGYVPVYGPADHPAVKIAAGPVRPTTNGGRIFVIGNKLLQVELGAGIHIIDYTDRKKPVKQGFVTVPGCQEVALKGGMLFTNDYADMVVLDVQNYPEVRETSRIKNVFPEVGYGTPPERGVYYECVNPAKGHVIGWEKKTISTNNCWH